MTTANFRIGGVDGATSAASRRIRTFHVRRGRMSATAHDALLRRSDDWLIPFVDGSWDPVAWYGRTSALVMDIGSGMGATTIEQALAEPDVDIIAIDVHTPGIGALFARAEQRDVTNVRAILADAVEVLDRMVPVDSLAGVRIYFPDPWPKIRHQKRRLIQPDFVDLLVSRLQPGGFVHCATDVPDYADQMVRVLGAHRELQNPHGGTAPRPADRPVTKFEARGLRRGHQIADVVVTRRLDP